MSAAHETESAEVEKPAKFGQYRVVRKLAQGGMSQIYEGTHPQLGSRVALKVMLPALAAQPMAAARFLREAKAASNIRHQNVVQVFDIGTENNVPFIVMEYLEGSNLAQLLSEKGAMSLTGIVDVFLPVISAVAMAHRAGIIHRDLKPSNLMITKRAPRGAQPIVLDFGISKMMGEDLETSLTKSESLVGTVQYMAPELTKGAKFASPASDQYALGVMLYECAAGKRPFTGDSYYDLMHAIVTSPVKPPSELRETLPPEFDDIVLRAMSRDPAGRFPSVEALGSALLSFGDKAAWALWESEFLGTPDEGREPWSVASATLNDGVVQATTTRRTPKRRGSLGALWALFALASYALVVTILLGLRRSSNGEATAAAPKAIDPMNATSALSSEVVPLDVVTAQPPASSPSIAEAARQPSAAPSAVGNPTLDVHSTPRTRRPAGSRERMAAGAAGPPIASAAPRPASTVGTNGAPIVE